MVPNRITRTPVKDLTDDGLLTLQWQHLESLIEVKGFFWPVVFRPLRQEKEVDGHFLWGSILHVAAEHGQKHLDKLNRLG